MTQTNDGPPRWVSGDGPLETSSFVDTHIHRQNPAPAQAFLSPFRREVAEGCFRLAALKLIHAANNIAIGDDVAAWPEIDCAEFHYAEGASLLREEEEGVE